MNQLNASAKFQLHKTTITRFGTAGSDINAYSSNDSCNPISKSSIDCIGDPTKFSSILCELITLGGSEM